MKTLLLLTFSLLTFTTVTSQYFGPKPVLIGDILTKNYQVIYPLGWSEDGTFAYIHQDINPLGAAEIYFYTVIIQNMKTDKILWVKHIKYDFEIEGNLENCKNYSSDDTLYNYAFFKQVVWDSYGQDIKDKLKLYNIEREDTSMNMVADLPKEISLKETERKEKEITNQYTIRLYKKDRFKPVYQFDCKRDKELCKVDESIWYSTFAVKGYFKSPFENQIAILVFKETNGFEESFEYPFFVGTHLEKGFMDIGCKQ